MLVAVVVRAIHQPSSQAGTSNLQVRPSNKIGSKRHDWLSHPQMVAMIFRQVEISKGYRPAIGELQQRHFVSGLFGRLLKVTVRGWYEPGSYTQLRPGALEAMQTFPSLLWRRKGLTRIWC